MKYKIIKTKKTKSSKYTNYITNKQWSKNKLEGLEKWFSRFEH